MLTILGFSHIHMHLFTFACLDLKCATWSGMKCEQMPANVNRNMCAMKCEHMLANVNTLCNEMWTNANKCEPQYLCYQMWTKCTMKCEPYASKCEHVCLQVLSLLAFSHIHMHLFTFACLGLKCATWSGMKVKNCQQMWTTTCVLWNVNIC